MQFSIVNPFEFVASCLNKAFSVSSNWTSTVLKTHSLFVEYQ